MVLPRVSFEKLDLALLAALLVACGSDDGSAGERGAGGGGGTSSVAAPSCDGAPKDCGPSANESCCSSPRVPGGTYLRDYDEVSMGSAGPDYQATVSDYRLDEFEVTVGRFRRFVAAWVSGWRPAAGAGKHAHLRSGEGLLNSAAQGGFETGWDPSFSQKLASDAAAWSQNLSCDPSYQTWTDIAGANDARPANCLTWFEAYAFCIWDGGFLPSEIEWNYAATGGSEQRVYAWSSPPTSTTIDESYASYYVDTTRQCFGDGMNGCAVTDLIRVGTKPAGNGRWGQADLLGNVSEWTLDWYTELYAKTCDNCAHLTAETFRAFRGQDFFTGGLGCSLRDYRDPSERKVTYGARCARRP